MVQIFWEGQAWWHVSSPVVVSLVLCWITRIPLLSPGTIFNSDSSKVFGRSWMADQLTAFRPFGTKIWFCSADPFYDPFYAFRPAMFDLLMKLLLENSTLFSRHLGPNLIVQFARLISSNSWDRCFDGWLIVGPQEHWLLVPCCLLSRITNANFFSGPS